MHARLFHVEEPLAQPVCPCVLSSLVPVSLGGAGRGVLSTPWSVLGGGRLGTILLTVWQVWDMLTLDPPFPPPYWGRSHLAGCWRGVAECGLSTLAPSSLGLALGGGCSGRRLWGRGLRRKGRG